MFIFITVFLSIIMIVIFILGMTVFRTYRHFVNNVPTYLTTLGILGTFIGISIGLSDFNSHPDNVDQSIVSMISGMKTAFITSIVGIGLSILFKVIVSIEKDRILFKQNLKYNTEDLILSQNSILEKQSEILNNIYENMQTKDYRELMDDMVSNLESISFKQELIYDKLSSNQEEFIESLDNFGTRISQNATKIVIESLEKVVHDFNINLINQFGDNFKKLDDSIYKLIEWQETYSETLESIKDYAEVNLESLNNTTQAIKDIAEEASGISSVVKGLGSIIDIHNKQISDFSIYYDTLSEIQERAKDAIPYLQNYHKLNEEHTKKITGQSTDLIVKTINSFQDSVDNMFLKFSAISDDVNRNIMDLGKNINLVNNYISNSHLNTSDIMKELETLIRTNLNQIQTYSNEFKEINSDNFKNLKNVYENEVELSNQYFKNSFIELEKAMSIEITRVVNIMGQALGSITQQFIDDYSEITKSIKDVSSKLRKIG